ncbi:MAG: DUF87 domain-containing protein [Candidatus Woesearchaeota archaeon]
MRTRKKNSIGIKYFLSITVLLILAVSVMVLVNRFIGYVYVETEPGTITQINLAIKDPTVYWHGFYGIIMMVPQFDAQQSALAQNGKIDLIHLLFPCLQPNIPHELYASLTQYPQWETVVAALPADVDAFLGLNSSAYSSANNTFTTNITVRLGPTVISNVPGTYTKQQVANLSSFNLGILKDGLGNLIYVTQIADYVEGFSGLTTNYQIMVATGNNTNRRYYFFTDPYDECPKGITFGLFGQRARLYGWVKDNATGARLDTVAVMLADNMTLTDSHGFYNFSVLSGIQIIAAAKNGYNNFIDLLNISPDSVREYNISMSQTAKYTYTSTGVGPGIGPGQSVGPGVGPGVSFKPDVGPYTEEPKRFEGLDIWISTTNIDKILRTGTFAEDPIFIFNFGVDPLLIEFSVRGNVSPSLKLDRTTLRIQPNSMANLTATFFGNQPLGNYFGNIDLGGDINFSIPLKVKIVSEEMLPVEALIVTVTPTKTRLTPDSDLRYKVDLNNLLTDQEYEVYLKYFIKDLNNSKIFSTDEDKVHLQTSYSLLKSYHIPRNASLGEYIIQVDAHYLELVTTGTAIFDVVAPFFQYMVFGLIPLWQLFLMIVALLFIIFAVWYIRRMISQKKRFHVKVEFDLLPSQGPRSIFVGKVAETNKKTYLDMDNLTVHTIVAGSTGGGKTISAQVIVEECLMKNVAVVVFDPTAQWSGYLRKCTDKKMMTFYPKFNLKKSDARAFKGNIRYVENPYEIIDLKKYMIPGNIQVFTMNKLDPKDIDIFVANTVREVFHLNLPEARELKLLLVYDEVHRLLPKFGGSGEGFIQIERACREFRKWGVGVMLISQVLADFVGQIKANINTEIQMKTRDEGDLNRIETKFGKGLIQSLVKSPIGSGMVQNAAYNRGNPFFIEFRPILHSVERLSDDELARYNKYNNQIDDVEYQIDQIEEHEIDVFDMRLELKLAKDKLQSGNFNMVDIYLEGLGPRLKSNFEKLGVTPKKRTIKMVDKASLESELKAAKDARAEYEKANKKDQPVEAKPQGPLKFGDDVPPDKILRLKNDMLVVNLKGLIDEIAALKPALYAQQVNEKKNDFADWIENVIGNKRLAKKVRETLGQQQLVALLDDAYKKEKSGVVEPEEKEEPQKKEEPQEKKAEPAAQEKKEEVKMPAQAVLPESIKAQISKTQSFIDKHDVDNATIAYNELTAMYRQLNKEQQALASQMCMDLRNNLQEIIRLSSMFKTGSQQIAEINDLLEKADALLKSGQHAQAFNTYQQIIAEYQALPPDQKPLVFQKCVDLHSKLSKRVVA